MTEFDVTTICADCGASIDASKDTPGNRLPCPSCNSTRRSHDTTLHLSAASSRVGMSLKAKRPNAKKPHVELKVGPSHSHKLGKPVEHRRLIDRTNDQYFEEVTDFESGEKIHHTNEPLSSHTGHGSAKRKK